MDRSLSHPDARPALTARLQALLSREERISRHLQGQDGRLEADFGDIANYTADDEILEGLDAAARAEIAQIQAALARLDAGTYGECVGCGEPIGERRLAVLPHTPLCVGCAAKQSLGA